jgi:hypothetical protein
VRRSCAQRTNDHGTARRHLERVQAAWYEPTDWDDLTLYGFYCLEAAVMAAGTSLGWKITSTHQAKVDAAIRLRVEHGLPDVYHLLIALNRARKAVAYGDTPLPDLNAEQVARGIEEYVEAVTRLMSARDET